MSTIKIVTDDASDIPLKHEDLYDIEVLPIEVTLGDEVFSGRNELDGADFYDMLADAEDMPQTEEISSFLFEELFGDLFEQGYTDVIYVSSGAQGRSSYYNAVLAREHFFECNSDAKANFNIYCINSGSYSAGYGFAVVEAAKMINREKEAAEIVKYLRDWFDTSALCFGLCDLKYAKKSPIIPIDSASVGELIGLRPIMMVKRGEFEILRKSREGSIPDEIADVTANQIKKGSPYCIIYSSDSEQKDALSSALIEVLGYPPADSYRVGAAVTTHTGPVVIGVVFSQK